jgi:hypothetical protein
MDQLDYYNLSKSSSIYSTTFKFDIIDRELKLLQIGYINQNIYYDTNYIILLNISIDTNTKRKLELLETRYIKYNMIKYKIDFKLSFIKFMIKTYYSNTDLIENVFHIYLMNMI